ncbi:PREDICTED: uncharacterized protein LOC101290859 [Fragaria vesca subsp. vesca]|uniref:uncharacterized protein LOC101290859 n=1 Tax=Fragaria vesca subsp. vesca TaxID=101020 RepID=UPI0002C34CC4|nr:PREDICTED: uncharacterized protein LOC101290859 [Fragaria vesca subsp. vesca]
MAAVKPLTTEAIALTEKKMDMALDDIIKMAKVAPKGKKQQRVSNKSQTFAKGITQDKPTKLRRYMDSRSTMRQGVLAQRRSNFQGNQFPVATEAARKAAVVPFRNRAFNRNQVPNWKPRAGAPIQRRAGNVGFGTKLPPQQQQWHRQQENVVANQKPQTLDLLFANMKEQRMRAQPPHQNIAAPQRNRGRPRLPWGRGGRFGN